VVRAALLLLLVSCSGSGRPERGLAAKLRIEGGAFYRGDLPDAAGGPLVKQVALGNSVVLPGMRNKPAKGTLAPSARAVAIALAGDPGYWIVPARPAEAAEPGQPTFNVGLSFAPDVVGPTLDLIVQASDAEGRFGPQEIQPLTVMTRPPPEGALVITLTWDRDADLDLHVVDPSGVEIFKRNINSYERPPPGEPVDPEAWKKGGILDFDSNAQCVIDGQRQENVVWKADPPKGRYLVRVDTFSLCSEITARWVVEARVAGNVVGRAEGQSTSGDTRAPHDRGAGVLALELDVP
jgi:hypothetical protein